MRLRDEIYSRYQEVHEGHVNVGRAERLAWMREAYRVNFRPHIVGKRVLEIACGAGDLLDVMAADGLVVTGTDLCYENVIGCRRRGLDVFHYDVFATTDPLAAFGVGQFDTIMMMGIIEHFTKDELLHVTESLHRTLRPGGAVILSTQNMDSLVGVHFRYLDLTHEVGFTRESLCQLGRLRFESAECYPWQHVNPVKANWKGRLLERAQRLYRRAYRAHVWMLGGWLADTWYDVDGLVGVWRKQMLASVIATRKGLTVRLVSRRLWVEVATWRSAASGLKVGTRWGWKKGPRYVGRWVSWAMMFSLSRPGQPDLPRTSTIPLAS